jgi:hypothetical protein
VSSENLDDRAGKVQGQRPVDARVALASPRISSAPVPFYVLIVSFSRHPSPSLLLV